MKFYLAKILRVVSNALFILALIMMVVCAVVSRDILEVISLGGQWRNTVNVFGIVVSITSIVKFFSLAFLLFYWTFCCAGLFGCLSGLIAERMNKANKEAK